MAYVVPIHRPSSVRHAIKLNFLEPDESALAVAKANRLEIYAQASEGLVLIHSRAVYGYITMLERLRPALSETDHLFVGTDRYQYFTVSWDSSRQQLRTEQSFVDQADKVLRDSRESDRSHIDPSRRYMTLELYDGVVTVIPIIQSRRKSSSSRRESVPVDGEAGTLGDPMQVRIEELTTRSSAFVQIAPGSKAKPRMALLWEDNLETPQLKIRELTYIPGAAGDPPSVDMKTVAELRGHLDLGVSHLIPVSAPYGGFLILGERSISYVDNGLLNMISQDLEEDATIWTTWEKVDEQRWLLGDDYGRLYFLMIDVTERSNTVDSWRLDQIGTTSKASVLVYLDEGFAFVGSHTGDSQVIQIQERGLAVVQTFANIAPILDVTIMDMGRGAEGAQTTEFSSGQARIVTASGAWQDGSIRSVRSGVGMEDLGTIGELSHITDMWAISSSGMTETDDTLLVTFVDETRIFKFDAQAAVEEVDSFCGLNFSEATLLAANLPDRKLLQVCGSGALVADLESGMTISEWKPLGSNVKVTAACSSLEHLLLVVGGTTLQVLDVANQLNPVASKAFSPTSEIASVTMPPSPSTVCIISFFQSASIAVLDLSSLTTVHEKILGEPGAALPRSVLVANVLSSCNPTLFIAMADGTVITFSFDSQKHVLGSMNRIVLGSEPVFFKLLPRDIGSGLFNVFASCEQPSLIYASEGRIIYSAVNSDKASRVCHFNSEAYQGAIAIATRTELKLAMIDTERTTQLETLSVGETVRCVSYSPAQQIFGMGCVRRILESGAEGLVSSVKIADEITFKELDSYELNEGELIECIISTGQLEVDDDDASQFNEMFVVGTSLLAIPGTSDDTTKGRIVVFEVNKDKKLKRVAELGVKGACRSLAMCEGKVVAGLVKTVVLYALTPSTTHGRHTISLSKLATYRTSTNPLSMSAYPSTAANPATVAVADLMKSVSILTLSIPSSTTSRSEWGLTEVARHFATLWSSAVTCIGENEWLVADMEGNLVVLRRNVGGVTEDDKRRLEVVSEGRLGEVVNTIVPVHIPSAPLARERAGSTTTVTANGSGKPPGPLVIPKAFLATVEGGVYLMGSISPAYQDLLMRLQNAVAGRVVAPGYMPWAKYRAFKTEVREGDEPYRFVDGELIEMVLGFDDVVLKDICQELGSGLGTEELRAMVEGLRRLH